MTALVRWLCRRGLIHAKRWWDLADGWFCPTCRQGVEP